MLVFSEMLTPQHVIQLVDGQGRAVLELVGNGSGSLVLERGNLASGLYLLRVVHRGETVGLQRVAVEPR